MSFVIYTYWRANSQRQGPKCFAKLVGDDVDAKPPQVVSWHDVYDIQGHGTACLRSIGFGYTFYKILKPQKLFSLYMSGRSLYSPLCQTFYETTTKKEFIIL